MVNRPSVPEIITVNSEELQTLIRDLLPSQNGFGSELQASNVITPIIDLTATAEGSRLPVSMQQALAFGSVTAFNARNSTATIANSPGFWRVFGGYSNSSNGAVVTADIRMSDGLSTKIIYSFLREANGGSQSESFDFIVFLAPGESISADTNDTAVQIGGCARQIATGDGTLVNPSGFPL